MALPASPRRFDHGSRYGADGIYYPAEEERTVPLSEQALRLIAYLYHALRYVFEAREDVHVGADQFLYWEPGNIEKKIAPDGFVIQGVPHEPPRAVIRIWEEAVPDLVIEISSEGSRGDDRGKKLEIYQNVLRVPEYLIYDEDRDELLFFRLEGGVYRRQQPAADGRYHSAGLGVAFSRDTEILLRIYGLDGAPVPEATEWVALYREMHTQLEAERERAEREWLRAEEERRNAETARRNAESERRRADQLALEVERLQAELERLRRQNPPEEA